MNTEKDKITQAIFAAIDEINETFPEEKRIGKSDDTPLVGPQSIIDSLGITLLIVAIEQKLQQTLGKNVALADTLLMATGTNPFETISTLQDHIAGLLENVSHE